MTCPYCNSTQHHIEIKKLPNGEHHAAFCDDCGKFIKNVPHAPAQFYFGKYKGKLVSEVADLSYLEWFVSNIKISNTMLDAVRTRIEQIKAIQ